MSISTTSKSVIRTEAETRILDAAEQVFAEYGFSGASMQQIADRAELPKANIHYYFGNKETLYRKLIQRILQNWLDAAHAFSEQDDPATVLTAYIDAKMELSRAQPAGSKIWATEIMHGAPHIKEYLQGELRDWMAKRVIAIQRWIDAGLIRPIEPQNLIYMIWATTQHYADFEIQIAVLNDNDPLSAQDWAKAKSDVVSIILGGVLTK